MSIYDFLVSRDHIGSGSTLVKSPLELGNSIHLFDYPSIEYSKRLYHLLLASYSLKRAHFFTLRPHNHFLLGKYHHLFNGDILIDNISTHILFNIYTKEFKDIFDDNINFIASIEYNFDSLKFIHFHFVIFDITNKRFNILLKEFKSRFSSTSSIKYIHGTFDNLCSMPDRAVVPKRYPMCDRPFALAYYMGFDKKHIRTEMKLKTSHFLTLYSFNITQLEFDTDTFNSNILHCNFIKKPLDFFSNT